MSTILDDLHQAIIADTSIKNAAVRLISTIPALAAAAGTGLTAAQSAQLNADLAALRLSNSGLSKAVSDNTPQGPVGPPAS